MKTAADWLGTFMRFGMAALLLMVTKPGTAADSLVWRQDQNMVAAEITSWDLTKLLENIATTTGWQIFVEPETKHTVSTKFKNRAPGEALRLLLGDLSFALLPQSNAPSRLFVFRTSLQEATQRVHAPEKPAGSKAAKPIANELIVTLKPGMKIDELARKLGAKVTGRAEGLNTYRLEFEDADATADALAKLKDNSDVASIDYNYRIDRPENPESLTYSSSAPFSLKPKAIGDANRIIVATIDTAVQDGSGIENFLLPSISVAGDAKTSNTQPTHGTSMAETVLRGLAMAFESTDGSRVRILPVDVYGSNPTSSTFDVAYGIYKAINAGATIINLSLGSEGESSFLKQVIRSGHDQGVLFFAAAGNFPVSTPTYPAAYPEVIAVTAGDRRGNIATYANYGAFVDVITPGSAVVNFRGQSWLVMGTSASTAYASGMAAGMVDQTGKSLSQVEAAIRSNFAFTTKKN